jgi:hypothetical protein
VTRRVSNNELGGSTQIKIMNSNFIIHFELDPDKLAIIQECMENYGVGSPEAEWANNIISRKAIVYQSGVIAREGSPVRHSVDRVELALCENLADTVEKLMAGVEAGMGSEASTHFRRFYIAANVDESIPSIINEELIRSKFGETIFPLATITIEPLIEAGIWWTEVVSDGAESGIEYFEAWKAMMVWFRSHSAFVDSAFVRIGDRKALWELDMEKVNLPVGTELTGCVLPRLALGLTHKGSLVGLFGYSLQT